MATFQDMNSDSSDSEDDVDYVPTENICSEDDSNDGVTSDDDGAGDDTKKPVSKRRGRKKKKPDLEEKEDEEKPELNEEDEKKRVENLYKSFLDDVKPIVRKPTQSSSSVTNGAPSEEKDKDVTATKKKITVTEEYEFAGETVTLTKEVDSEAATVIEGTSSKTTSLQDPVKAPVEKTVAPPMKRPAAGGGGLSSIIGVLNKKKQKLSTLQKSLLDWNSFKKDEGISEELETHNKGKDGYLERQAFLQRSDLRQFEIEKELRLSRRRTQQ